MKRNRDQRFERAILDICDAFEGKWRPGCSPEERDAMAQYLEAKTLAWDNANHFRPLRYTGTHPLPIETRQKYIEQWLASITSRRLLTYAPLP
jgi:hypothetical protein